MTKEELIKKMISLKILDEKEMVLIPPTKRFRFKKGDKIIYDYETEPQEGEVFSYDPGNLSSDKRVSFYTLKQLNKMKETPSIQIEPIFEYVWRIKPADENKIEYENRPRIYIKKNDQQLLNLTELIGGHIPVICPTSENELFTTIFSDSSMVVGDHGQNNKTDTVENYNNYLITKIIPYDFGFFYILNYKKKYMILTTQFVFHGGLLKPKIHKISKKEYEDILSIKE